MAKSKRQRIVDAVLLRMATIKAANGYETNIGLNVHDWRVNFQDDELPALSVCDLVAEAVPPRSTSDTKTIHTLPLQIRVYLSKEDTPANGRKVIKDIYKAIRVDDRWPESGKELAMWTTPKSDGFIIPDDSFEIIGVAVDIEIVFITKKFDAEA